MLDRLRERLERLKNTSSYALHPPGIPSQECVNRSIYQEAPFIRPTKPTKGQQGSIETGSSKADRVLQLSEIRDQRMEWVISRIRRLEKPHVLANGKYMRSALEAVRTEMQSLLQVWEELDVAEWEFKKAQNSDKTQDGEKEAGKSKEKLKKREKERRTEKGNDEGKEKTKKGK
jgi:hypothetical protein